MSKTSPRKTTKKIDTTKLEALVVNALKTVYDPELPVDIYELGLIYNISVKPRGRVDILMTLTTPNCPVADTLPHDVKMAVETISQVKQAKVVLTFEPPWDKTQMSQEAREALGF